MSVPFFTQFVPKNGTTGRGTPRARDRETGRRPVPFPVPFSPAERPVLEFADVPEAS
jgi:hypothetical protein